MERSEPSSKRRNEHVAAAEGDGGDETLAPGHLPRRRNTNAQTAASVSTVDHSTSSAASASPSLTRPSSRASISGTSLLQPQHGGSGLKPRTASNDASSISSRERSKSDVRRISTARDKDATLQSSSSSARRHQERRNGSSRNSSERDGAVSSSSSSSSSSGASSPSASKRAAPAPVDLTVAGSETRLERRRSMPAHMAKRHSTLSPASTNLLVRKKLRRQRSDDLGSLVEDMVSASLADQSQRKQAPTMGPPIAASSAPGVRTRGETAATRATTSLGDAKSGGSSKRLQRRDTSSSSSASSGRSSRDREQLRSGGERSSDEANPSPKPSTRRTSSVVAGGSGEKPMASPRDRSRPSAKRSGESKDSEHTPPPSASDGSDAAVTSSGASGEPRPHVSGGSGSSSSRRKEAKAAGTESDLEKLSGRRSERSDRRRSVNLKELSQLMDATATADDHKARGDLAKASLALEAVNGVSGSRHSPSESRRERDASKRATLRMNWTVGVRGEISALAAVPPSKRPSVLTMLAGADEESAPKKARTPRGMSTTTKTSARGSASSSQSSRDVKHRRERTKERGRERSGESSHHRRSGAAAKSGEATKDNAAAAAVDGSDTSGRTKRGANKEDAASTRKKSDERRKESRSDKHERRQRGSGNADGSAPADKADQSRNGEADEKPQQTEDADGKTEKTEENDEDGGSSTGSAIVYTAEEAEQREADDQVAIEREIERVAAVLADAKESASRSGSRIGIREDAPPPIRETNADSCVALEAAHTAAASAQSRFWSGEGLSMTSSVDGYLMPPQGRSFSMSSERPPNFDRTQPSSLSSSMNLSSSSTFATAAAAAATTNKRDSFSQFVGRQRYSHMSGSSTVGRAHARSIDRSPLTQADISQTSAVRGNKRHARKRTLTAQELLDKYFAQQQQQQQQQQLQQRSQHKLGSVTMGRASRAGSVGRRRPLLAETMGRRISSDNISALGSGLGTASTSTSTSESSSSDLLSSSGGPARPTSPLSNSQQGSAAKSGQTPGSPLASASASAPPASTAIELNGVSPAAAAVLSPRKRSDLQRMLRMSGERFIVPKPGGERGKLLVSGSKLSVTTAPLTAKLASVVAIPMGESGESADRSDTKDSEDDDSEDSEDDEEDDEDEDEDDDEDDEDEEDDDDGDLTLDVAIREQRLGVIAALLRKVDAATGRGAFKRSSQHPLSRVPSLMTEDVDGNPGPGGTPLHLAASLPPDHKRRDKVFEYIMNYSVKHRQRREDEEEEKLAMIAGGDGAMDLRREERLMGRKRKQSYALTAARNRFMEADDDDDDEDGDDEDRGLARRQGEGLGGGDVDVPAWQWIDAPNREGDSALHVAATKGYLFAVTKLIQDGMVDPDIVNMLERTALHLACRWGRTDVCVALLAAGATLDRVDDKGKTAYDLANQHGHAECATYLMKEGADALLHYQCPPVPASSQRYEAMADTSHDRFGWVVREPAPPVSGSSSSSRNQSLTSSSSTVPTRAALQRKTASKRMELRDTKREKKWKEMIKRWDQVEAGRAGRESKKDPKYQKKLRQRVLKGIPNRLRGQVWARLASIEELRAQHGGSIYDPWHQGSKYIKQIDMDIEQTDRDHIFYRQRYGPKQRSLFAVLKAYGVHNPLVGYKQGMASVTSTILMYIDDEEEVFWMLESMMQCYGLEDIYKSDSPGLKKMFFLQDQLMRCFLPSLHDHFHKQSIRTSPYLSKWVITMFRSLPFHVSLRVWDYFFYEGTIALITVSLALVSIFAGRLESLGFEGIMLVLNNMHKESINADRLIKTAVNLQAKIERFDLIAKLNACYVSGRSESSAGLNVARVLLKRRPRDAQVPATAPTAAGTGVVSPRRLSDVRPLGPVSLTPTAHNRNSFG